MITYSRSLQNGQLKNSRMWLHFVISYYTSVYLLIYATTNGIIWKPPNKSNIRPWRRRSITYRKTPRGVSRRLWTCWCLFISEKFQKKGMLTKSCPKPSRFGWSGTGKRQHPHCRQELDKTRAIIARRGLSIWHFSAYKLQKQVTAIRMRSPSL